MNFGKQQSGFDLNVDLSALEVIKCPSCNGKFFKQVSVLRRLPKLMSGSPTDIPVSIPVWRCTSCGTVLTEFVPRAAGPGGLLGDDEETNESV